MPPPAIAYDFGIAEITVKVHRGQVMRKMKAASLPDLARMADKLTSRRKSLRAVRPAHRGTEDLQTRLWSKADSNRWSHLRDEN